MLIDFVRIILSCGACFVVCSFCFCDGSIRFLLITFKTWTYQKWKNIYEIHLFQLDWCFCFSLLITRKIHWSLVCLWLVKNVILHLYIYVRYGWYILNVWKYCCAHDCVVNWSRFSLTNYALDPVHVFTLLCKTSLIRVSFSVVYHVILCVGP